MSSTTCRPQHVVHRMYPYPQDIDIPQDRYHSIDQNCCKPVNKRKFSFKIKINPRGEFLNSWAWLLQNFWICAQGLVWQVSLSLSLVYLSLMIYVATFILLWFCFVFDFALFLLLLLLCFCFCFAFAFALLFFFFVFVFAFAPAFFCFCFAFALLCFYFAFSLPLFFFLLLFCFCCVLVWQGHRHELDVVWSARLQPEKNNVRLLLYIYID